MRKQLTFISKIIYTFEHLYLITITVDVECGSNTCVLMVAYNVFASNQIWIIEKNNIQVFFTKIRQDYT